MSPVVLYAVLAAITGGALVACAAYVWRQSPRPPAAGEFVLVIAAVATHATAYACCLLCTTLPWANAWYNVAMIGIAAIAPTIIAFAFAYAGRALPKRVLALLAVIPVVTLLASWTNDWHALIWTETRMEHVEGMVVRSAVRGPVWWVFLAFGYACIVASAAVFLATWLQGSIIHRRQSLLLFLGVVVPLTANVFYFAARPHIDVTPFAYSVTAVTWTWALTRLELLDLAPVAHDVVLRSIDELVLVLNARGRIVSTNRAAQAFFHRSERELLGMSASALIGGALVGVCADDAQEIEVDGRYFTVRRTALSETADEGAVVVMRDTTLRRETEDAREAALVAARETMRMRSELLARTSHEIRTPLHGILGSAGLLNETQLDASQRRWVEAIVGCGASLLEIVNSVLDLEQARAGRMRPRLAPLHVRTLTTGVIALFEGAAAKRGLELRLVQDAIPEWVQGDGLRLRQMLSNLVGNAVKFADRGTIEARLAYEAGWLQVAVVDEGPGIDPQTMAKLFVPFEPGDARVGAGNGLGLALTREIASALGGTITVDAHEGGTRAVLRLPFAESTTPECASVTTSHRRGRVLVVDDHPLNTAIVQARLESLGCSVVSTLSASEAIALAAHEAFDLVLMDVHMPEISGVDATRAIRGTKNERVLPIVGFSADTQASTRQECLDAGMQGLLRKPFEEGELERVLGLYLTVHDEVNEHAVVLARSRAHDAYRTSVHADLSEMSAAIAQPDPAQAARLAHRLRGAAVLLDLTAVARACAVIEYSNSAELTLAFQELRAAVDASLEEAS